MRSHQSGGRKVRQSSHGSKSSRIPGSLSVPIAGVVCKNAHAWKLAALLLISAGAGLHAQEPARHECDD